MKDLVHQAAREAARAFGGAPGVFTSSGFARAFARLAGLGTPIDHDVVRAVLTGRADVENCPPGKDERTFYRLVETAARAEMIGRLTPEQEAFARGVVRLLDAVPSKPRRTWEATVVALVAEIDALRF